MGGCGYRDDGVNKCCVPKDDSEDGESRVCVLDMLPSVAGR